MAIINKKDFEIFCDIFEDIDENEYFECDELIAPTIKILNLKGYKTVSCCSGHPYISDREAIIFKSKNPATVFSGTYEIKALVGNKHKVRFRQYIYTEANIVFCDDSIPSTLPDGWMLEDNKISIQIVEDQFLKYDFFTKSVDGFEFDLFAKSLQIMKDLYEWANNLPIKKGN